MNKIFDRLKFLFVIDNLSTGGAQRQMVNLALGLTKRGYQVEIFCYAPGDLLAQPLVDAGIQIHWHYKSSRFSPDVILSLRNLISCGQFNLVLSFLTTPNFYAILAGRMFALQRVPVIVSERFCDLPEGVPMIERIVRQFYRFASQIVTNSYHQHENMARKYPWVRNHLSTIYNGYDLQVYLPADFYHNNHPLKILVIASVSPYKNGLCLVEALHILNTCYDLSPIVDWIGQLVMKGDRLQYLNKMKQAIKDYGLDQQWNWLNQRSDISNQLHLHDVLIHPSYGEGLPNVVCEALACAKPVILSNTLDHARLVQDNISGFLFDYRDPKELSEKIRLFINLSMEERQKMGQNGRKFAETNLSLDRFLDDYEKLFKSVLIN